MKKGKNSRSKAGEKKEIWIFYSSQTEPDLIKFYSEGISYLQESKIKTHVIDINEKPKAASKYKVIATPVLIIKKGGEVKKYLGVVDGLKNILASDLYGISILHKLGFKEGRNFARKLRLSEETREMGEVLSQSLSSRGIVSFNLMEFNPKSVYARVKLVYDSSKIHTKSKTDAKRELAAFLGGLFTEVFGVGVIARDKEYFDQGDNFCEFEIMEADVNRKDVAKMVMGAIK